MILQLIILFFELNSTDCKSVVSDFGGPNPPSPTKRISLENTGKRIASRLFSCVFSVFMIIRYASLKINCQKSSEIIKTKVGVKVGVNLIDFIRHHILLYKNVKIAFQVLTEISIYRFPLSCIRYNKNWIFEMRF